MIEFKFNNESKISRNHLNKGWEKNGSEDVWTLSNINESNGVESAEKTLKIVLKQDYYKLKDFAYFGSCCSSCYYHKWY